MTQSNKAHFYLQLTFKNNFIFCAVARRFTIGLTTTNRQTSSVASVWEFSPFTRIVRQSFRNLTAQCGCGQLGLLIFMNAFRHFAFICSLNKKADNRDAGFSTLRSLCKRSLDLWNKYAFENNKCCFRQKQPKAFHEIKFIVLFSRKTHVPR